MADQNKKKYIKYEDTTYILEDSRLPEPSAADNGKVLGVVNGEYALKQEEGGGGAVTSVNGKTGAVALTASDVHALPDSTVIPKAVTEQDVAGWGFTKNTGTYSKPSGGIPASDLAADMPFFTLPEGGEAGQALISDGEGGAEWGQAGVEVDATLSIEGEAADAAAVGDAIEAIYEQMDSIGGGGVSQTAIQLFGTILGNAIYKDDQSSNITALLAALNSGGGGGDVYYTVTNNLTNARTSNSARRAAEGSSYVATITLDEFAVLQSATVTMGGVNITSTVYNNGNINIPNVTGDIVITVNARSTASLDAIAYGNLSYRDIFITGNILTGFDFENGMPTQATINTGSPVISEDDSYSVSHSLKCFGSSSNTVQISGYTGLEVGKKYFFAMKVKCTRYVKGYLGGTKTGYKIPYVNRVTDGWETIYTYAQGNKSVFSNFVLGGFTSADLDGYIDDVVLIPIENVLGELVSEQNMLAMYNIYADLRKAGAV